MSDAKQLLTSQGPRLVPFFICLIIYFAYVQDAYSKYWTTLLKCGPIVCLILYTVLKEFNFTKDFRHSQLILLGLIFSCGGDALLNIDLFPLGMGLFALAQICYTFAFGLKPLKWFIAAPLFLAGAAYVAIIFQHLDNILSIALPIYVVLLLTMCWRSIARAVDHKCFLSTFCAIGSITFVISDGLIAADMFLIKISHARLWIMVTYYFAQFAITLSVTNEGVKKKSSKL